MDLYIDLETYSSVDIKTAGAYKYVESVDFEILILCYAINDGPIITVDLAQGEEIPLNFQNLLLNSIVTKHAHNANFERICFKAIDIDVPIEQWRCTAIKSAYCGLPISLAGVSEALHLEEKGKLLTGMALIRYFSCPIKPTKANGMRVRNFPHHDPVKWQMYKDYCVNDVEAEREIDNLLKSYNIPDTEQQLYILDQEINDAGILIDLKFAENAIKINAISDTKITESLKLITNLDNPNSPAQLKEWLCNATGKDITTLAKANITELLETETGEALEVLGLRQKGAKTSIKKYAAMLACACYDNRAHGLFQFYGANRTGRWAGRLIQLQNLPKNFLEALDYLRHIFAGNITDIDFDLIEVSYETIPNILSQLIRAAFIALEGKTFAVADFSAIEARIIAWLANESWRMEVFATHGKIYEASAAMMFGIPIESIKKGSSERDKGKVAELALGYAGSLGALIKMGGEEMGLSNSEMQNIVKMWRKASPQIVKLWAAVDAAAIAATEFKKRIVLSQFKNLAFEHDGKVLTIQLPSGRKLFYQEACLTINKFGVKAVKYKGLDQVTKKWWWVDSYGGKFVENIVQAIARDCLANSMLQLRKCNFSIVMHVHDEIVAEVDVNTCSRNLQVMCDIMGAPITWAQGLILTADGYTTPYYKKD